MRVYLSSQNKRTMYKGILLSLLCSNLMFAQQTTESIFGDLSGRHIGPALMSGRVSDIEGHPKNKQIIYIGAAGGGVWKSQDGGVIFNSIFDNCTQSIGAVRVDPSDPDNTIWVGTGECWTRNSVSVGDGIYRSTDGGKNWTNLGLQQSERISSIQIHPTDKNTVYTPDSRYSRPGNRLPICNYSQSFKRSLSMF